MENIRGEKFGLKNRQASQSIKYSAMLICFNQFGEVTSASPENLPPFVAAELLMRLKGRGDFDAVEAEAEEEEAYKSETYQKKEE